MMTYKDSVIFRKRRLIVNLFNYFYVSKHMQVYFQNV